MGLFVVLGIWKSGGFGLSRWDLGIALPKKILEICVRQFVGFWKIDEFILAIYPFSCTSKDSRRA